MRSLFQPGRSLQRAATQRACGRSIVAAARSSRVSAGVTATGAAPALGAVPAVAAGGGGVLEHAASPSAMSSARLPRIGAVASGLARAKALVMWVILLEAFGALLLLLVIVWWTMFAGRRKGERVDDDEA